MRPTPASITDRLEHGATQADEEITHDQRAQGDHPERQRPGPLGPGRTFGEALNSRAARSEKPVGGVLAVATSVAGRRRVISDASSPVRTRRQVGIQAGIRRLLRQPASCAGAALAASLPGLVSMAVRASCRRRQHPSSCRCARRRSALARGLGYPWARGQPASSIRAGRRTTGHPSGKGFEAPGQASRCCGQRCW